MAVTYPVSPTTVTLANAVVGGILRDYRESGYVQGYATVRSPDKQFNSVDIYEQGRKFDFKTATFVNAALAVATPATTDIIQTIGVDPGDVITGGSLRVIRAASGGSTATATIKCGSVTISSAIDLLTLGTTAFNTSCPFAVGSTPDTIDMVLTGTTSPVFDAQVELIVFTQPNRG